MHMHMHMHMHRHRHMHAHMHMHMHMHMHIPPRVEAAVQTAEEAEARAQLHQQPQVGHERIGYVRRTAAALLAQPRLALEVGATARWYH